MEHAVLKAAPFGGRPKPICCEGAVTLDITFTLPRPQSAKRGAVPNKAPDLSKLIRSTEDALTQMAVWEDDSRVVSIIAAKRYPNEGEDALPVPGAVIRIESA